MIAKKNSKLDLEQKRSAFFGLGLLVTSSLCLAAFSYSDATLHDNGADLAAKNKNSMEFEIIPMEIEKKDEPVLDKPEKVELPTTPQVKAEPVVSQEIKATVNQSKIPDPTVGVATTIPTGTMDVLTKANEFNEKVFEFADIDAEFIGGRPEMLRFINTTVEYPEISLQFKDQGTVYVRFVIEKDGSVSNVEIERGVTKELNREAVRVIKKFPKWKPGEVGFEPVRTRVRVPINFVIAE